MRHFGQLLVEAGDDRGLNHRKEMMKIKTLAVQAVAALALCGLFASSASADQSALETPNGYTYAFCGPKPPDVLAWFEEHEESQPSLSEWAEYSSLQREALMKKWEEHEAAVRALMPKYCAFIVANLTEPEEVTLGRTVEACVAENVAQPWDNENPSGPTGEPWTEAEIDAIEQCAAPNGTGATVSRSDRGAKHKKHSKSKKHHSAKKRQHRSASI